MRTGENRTTKTTLWSERSSALKKDLTGPTLLEMYDYPTLQELGSQPLPNQQTSLAKFLSLATRRRRS
jgi:hypothetical protein